MKRDRYFYTTTAAVLLILTAVGFHRFFLEGRGFDGGKIPPVLLTLVVLHGLAITAWIVLFFLGTVLIAANNRAAHMKLGWFTVAVAATIAVTGPTVAISSPRLRGDFPIFGMTYHQFMLPMLTEIALFSLFVALGVAYRKRPPVHRSMMLLATLSVISGATSRTPLFIALFGEIGWVALFGPVFALAVLLLVVRSFVSGRFDRPFAVGLAAMMAIYIGAMSVATTRVWTQWSQRLAPTPAPAAEVVSN